MHEHRPHVIKVADAHVSVQHIEAFWLNDTFASPRVYVVTSRWSGYEEFNTPEQADEFLAKLNRAFAEVPCAPAHAD